MATRHTSSSAKYDDLMSFDGLETQNRRENEVDKYAPLFSPPTPRATPTSKPIFPENQPPPLDLSRSSERKRHHPQSASSADSEFGAFVSVPPSQDPLISFGSSSPTTYTFPSFSPLLKKEFTPSHSEQNDAKELPDVIHTQRTSNQDFFKRVGAEAQQASEQHKHDVLDELLRNEADPLSFLESQTPELHQRHETFNTLSEGSELSIPENAEQATTVNTVDAMLHSAPVLPAERAEPSAEIRSTLIRMPDFDELPPRSPSVPIPSSPLQDGSDERNSSYGVPLQRSHSHAPASPPPPIRRESSSSYDSIGVLSSRFMSSLLNTTRTAVASTAPEMHSTINTFFSQPGNATDPLRAISPSRSISPSSLPRHRADSVRSRFPAHAKSVSSIFSTAAPNPAPVPTSSLISHGTPFAAHPYVPPSGAPGFTGDHQWDKGFSNDFDKEKAERKSVRLLGRKDSTTAILDSHLADLLRPNLPALARLPRSWTLLYSLDQHGISLKTLYTRCEAQTKAAGMLMVVRDSGDGVFGVWSGEGIRLEKNGYYGSGESFLWKMCQDKLHVYKWTGRNDYVALCEPDYISFGGGDGHYGLYLDDTLYDGSSARCPTFDNEPLCSNAPRKGGTATFECVGLEIWAVGP